MRRIGVLLASLALNGCVSSAAVPKIEKRTDPVADFQKNAKKACFSAIDDLRSKIEFSGGQCENFFSEIDPAAEKVQSKCRGNNDGAAGAAGAVRAFFREQCKQQGGL